MTWRDGRQVRAHRQAMIDAGYDVTGKVVMHLCDNPPCVNVNHLRVGTVAENNADRDAKGRARGGAGARRGERNHQAKLTQEQVNEIRQRMLSAQRGTQARLAEEYGLHRTYVGKIVRGDVWS